MEDNPDYIVQLMSSPNTFLKTKHAIYPLIALQDPTASEVRKGTAFATKLQVDSSDNDIVVMLSINPDVQTDTNVDYFTRLPGIRNTEKLVFERHQGNFNSNLLVYKPPLHLKSGIRKTLKLDHLTDPSSIDRVGVKKIYVIKNIGSKTKKFKVVIGENGKYKLLKNRDHFTSNDLLPIGAPVLNCNKRIFSKSTKKLVGMVESVGEDGTLSVLQFTVELIREIINGERSEDNKMQDDADSQEMDPPRRKSENIKVQGDAGSGEMGASDSIPQQAHKAFPPPLSRFYLVAQTSGGSVSNCYPPDSAYHARVQLDQKLQNIQKGKVQILHGPIGTGKRSAALHFMDCAREKFSVSWRIDCSKDENSIHSCLFYLAGMLKEESDESFSLLFQAIKEKAKKENVIFLLDSLQERRSGSWLQELWKIKDSLNIIVTTNNASLDLPFSDVEKISVNKFDEAQTFLKEAKEVSDENSDDDVKELCDHFSWNVLGLTSAKIYIMEMKISIQEYLEMLRDKEAALLVRKTEQEKQSTTLYAAVRAYFEQIDRNRFQAVAVISLIAHERIPEFLLSNVFPSSSDPVKRAYICDLQSSLLLKSLVHITNEHNVRFFSFHKFTQSVVRDLLDENQDLRKELMYKMAGILVKYFNKDNRFRKDAFMQRILVNHAEAFLQLWNEDEIDDITLIVLARLSELVGFTYTQRQPVSEHSLKMHFQRAEGFLHQLCGITANDFQAKSCQENDASLISLGILDTDTSVGQHLFEKLSQKSSQLPDATVYELAFSRTINSEDLTLFPKVVRDNSSLKKKANSFEPLSNRDIDLLMNKGVAYTVDDYRKLLLPELYASLLYSYGRNYFYLNKQSIQQPSFYVNRLKWAYCISREISKRMKPGEAVMHEYLAQSNALLYLLVNREVINEDGRLKTKEKKDYCQDLKNAAKYYQMLSQSEMKFFEMGILKNNKEDKLGQLVCQFHIVQCYIKLLSPEMTSANEERDQLISDGVKHCAILLKLVDVQTLRGDSGRVTKSLEQFSKYLNVVGEFYLAASFDSYMYLLRAWRMFTDSAANKEIKKEFHDQFSLQALIGLADVFSRLGKQCFIATQISIRQLSLCNRFKNFHEILHHQPQVAEQVLEVKKRNTDAIEKHYAKLWRRVVAM